mgnify:CR=1 FL=1
MIETDKLVAADRIIAPQSKSAQEEALERALACTPEPRWVVAVGDCAVDGGVFKGSYAVEGGIGQS